MLGIAYINNKKIILRFKNFHDFAKIDSLFFSKIIINNLVSWQINDERNLNSFASIPYILNDIKIIKTRTNAKLEVMIHDYFCICPSYTLTNENNEYCHVPKNLNLCNRCLNNNHELSCKPSFDFNLELWRQAWHDIFKISTCIYLFSKSSLYILNKIFKMDEYIYAIKPHTPLINWKTKIIIPKDNPMTIAVIGNLSFAKGANIVYELLNYLQEDEKIIVIGNIHMKRNFKKNNKLQIHGSYELEELPNLIKHYNITIALIPSIWPETFSYTTQECMILGIPTVTFNLGAQGERIGSWKYGLLAKECTAQSAYFALSELDSMRKCHTMN